MRVVDMEGSVTRLKEKMEDLHMHLEDIFKAIVTSQGCSPPSFPESSAKAAKSAEIMKLTPNMFEDNYTRLLSKTDFLHTSKPFAKDLFAAMREEDVHLDGKESASEKK